MPAIKDLYKNCEIDPLDLELIISHVIKKPREFVLTHPDKIITKKQETKIKKFIKRRKTGEPLAYILGHKEFYGLDFKVNKNVLIPRPETELLVEEAIKSLKTKTYKLKTIIIDVGTGSGNIIISLTQNIKCMPHDIQYLAIDKSKKALNIANSNAKKFKLDKKIKFLHGNLLTPTIKNKKCLIQNTKCVILVNLPYVSSENYKKYYQKLKYEPRSSLLSIDDGLSHYKKLFRQIKLLFTKYKIQAIIFIEFSPEQKNKLTELIKTYFPNAKIKFKKDLSGKWRMCKIDLKT